jgi:hypothetical protein
MRKLKKGMFADFSARGRWWLPDRSADQISGTLRFSNQRTELQLDSAFNTPELVGVWNTGSYRTPVIFGVSTDGIPYSVLRAVFVRWSASEIVFVGNSVVIGAHVLDVNEPLVHNVTLQFSHLTSWVARRHIQSDLQQASGHVTLTVPNRSETLISLDGLSQFKSLVLESYVHLSRDLMNATLSNESEFNLVFEAPASLSAITQITRELSGLLTLLVGEAVYPTSITAELHDSSKSRKTEVDYIFSLKANAVVERSEFEMILPYPQLEKALAEKLFRNWLLKNQAVRPVTDLLLSVVYNPSQYVQSSFLSLAQAIESFHRRIFEGRYVAKSDFNPIREKIVEAIPLETPASLCRKLTSMLAFGNEFSLQDRLKELLAWLDQDTLKAFIGDNTPEQLIKLIASVRNYLTHYDEESKPQIVDSLLEMYNFNQRIRAILVLLIFKHLGIEESRISLSLRGNLGLVG